MFHKHFGVLAVLALTSACDPIYDEFSSPGGYPAVQADRLLKAVTFQQHADRYRTVSYFLAGMSLNAAYDDDSAEEAIRNYLALLDTLDTMDTALAKCSYKSDAIASCVSDLSSETSFDFEELSLDAQRDLRDVAIDLIDSLGLRLSSNDISSITNLTTLAGFIWDLQSQIGAVREVAAGYRGMTHIYARTVATQFSGVTKGACEQLKTELDDLYIKGKFVTSPTIETEDSTTAYRRLNRLFELSNECVETQNSNENTGSYWTDNYKKAAKALVHKACLKAQKLTSDDACGTL